LESGLEKLSAQLKIRDTSVSGRTENKRTGLLKYIRVEGGLIHGNSGGALVDMEGNVRCVADAIVFERSTGMVSAIGLAIPSEYVQRLLWGFPLETTPKLPYKASEAYAKLPVEIKFGDPMKRVKKVWIEYWTGTPTYVTLEGYAGQGLGQKIPLPRRNSATKPKPRPNDSERSSVECTYDPEKGIAKGEFILTDTEPGYAHWIQVRYIDGTGAEKWGDAVFYAPEGSPVERRDLLLKPKFAKGSVRVIEVDSEADYRYVVYGVDRGHTMRLSARLSERMLGTDPATRLQGVEYRFDKILFGPPRTRGELVTMILAGLENPQLFQQQCRELIMRAGFTSDGLLTKSVVDTSRVPNPIQQVLYKQFADQVLEAIQLMCIKFPNKTVAYGESWEQPLNLHIETRKKHEPALYKLKMTYQGIRDRGGRREAVVEIKGSIARDDKAETIELKTKDRKDTDDDEEPMETPKDKDASAELQTPKKKDAPKDKGKDKDSDKDKSEPAPSGGKRPLYGLVRGYAYVDVEMGTVSTCELYIDIDTEITVKDPGTKADVPTKAGGTIQLRLVRHASDK
jgi:hypothetical protein